MKKRTTLNWQKQGHFVAVSIGVFLFTANSAAIAQETWARGDEWRAQYKVGDKVQHSVSGAASDFQTCTVTENDPKDLMRVKCDAFKYWVAGNYIASERSIRPVQNGKRENRYWNYHRRK